MGNSKKIYLIKRNLSVFQHRFCHGEQRTAVGKAEILCTLGQKLFPFAQRDRRRFRRRLKCQCQHAPPSSMVMRLSSGESFSMVTLISSP